MRDEEETDVERRVASALRPDDERTRRVIAGALAVQGPARHVAPVAFATVAVLLVIVAASLLLRSTPSPDVARDPRDPREPRLHIVGADSVVVVTSADGRRWVIDRRIDTTPTGQYVIVLPR